MKEKLNYCKWLWGERIGGLNDDECVVEFTSYNRVIKEQIHKTNLKKGKIISIVTIGNALLMFTISPGMSNTLDKTGKKLKDGAKRKLNLTVIMLLKYNQLCNNQKLPKNKM